MSASNRTVVLASRPAGVAQAHNFILQEIPIRAPEAGEILVQTSYLSVEPAMRGWIADTQGYAPTVPLGSVMRALATGHVIASHDPAYKPGDAVMGWFGWQTHATVPASAVQRRIDDRDLTLSLGILGINGITAYLALTLIGQPQPGDTVLVTTAAGSVGSAAGQIARILGCRTVGIAGGAEKVERCLKEYSYDVALNYQAPGLATAIAEACPKGIDVFFDNTSGSIADAVHPHMALRSRIIVCGTASFDRWDPWPTGPRIERHLLLKRTRMEGFVVFDHEDSYDIAIAQLRQWIEEKRLVHHEDILDGLEACPDALAGLYRGENKGKRLIRV